MHLLVLDVSSVLVVSGIAPCGACDHETKSASQHPSSIGRLRESSAYAEAPVNKNATSKVSL